MRKIGKTKELCGPMKEHNPFLERYCGLCSGLYEWLGEEIIDGRVHLKRELCSECKKCKHFLFTKIMKIAGCIIAPVLCFAFLWMMTTPQGAIRRHLLVLEGVHSAVSAEIRGVGEKNNSRYNRYYMVTVDGEAKLWQLFEMTYSCFGYPVD